MKGTVYSGVVYLPKYRDADMHGLLRAVVRTSSVLRLAESLRVYDIPFHPLMLSQGIWCESKSMVENAASERFYGQVIVCPLWCQYLKAENYVPIPKEFKCRQTA